MTKTRRKRERKSSNSEKSPATIDKRRAFGRGRSGESERYVLSVLSECVCALTTKRLSRSD